MGFPSTYGPPLPVVVFADNRGFEPLFDEAQNAPIDNALGHHDQQLGVRDAVEVFRQVRIYDVGVTGPQRVGDVVHGIMRRLPRPKRFTTAKLVNPYECAQKSASKIGSMTSFTAICATRSRNVGIPSGRRLPSAFGIITRRTGWAR
jgi:hypothetical protein